MISSIGIWRSGKKVRKRCRIAGPNLLASLAAALLVLLLVVGLTGCGKKEEKQKTQMITGKKERISQSKPGQLTESVSVGTKKPRSLAVMYFQNLAGDQDMDWISRGIAELLITDLSQSPSLRVLNGQRFFNILREMNSENLRYTDEITAVEVAQRAGSEVILSGSFTKIGEMVSIEAQLLEMATANLIKIEKVQGRGLESIFTMVDQLSRAIRDSLRIPLAEDETDRDIADLTTSSVEAYEAFTKATKKFYRFESIEALAMMERAVEIDSNFAMAYAVIAGYSNSMGDKSWTKTATGKAMAHLDRLPEPERLMVLAIDAQLRGDYDEGVRLYNEVLGSTPEEKNPNFYLGLAQLYFSKGELEKAKRIYNQILRWDPHLAVAHYKLGLVHFQQEMVDSTVLELQEAIRLSPDMAGAHLLLAQIYSFQGRIDEAESSIRKAIDAEPENPSIRNLLGYHYLRRRDYDQAIAEFKQSVALAPNDPNSHDSLAEGYFQKGDFARAEKEYLQALKLSPDWANSYYMLGLIYERNGQAQKAIQHLEKFIRLSPEDLRTMDAQKRVERLRQG